MSLTDGITIASTIVTAITLVVVALQLQSSQQANLLAIEMFRHQLYVDMTYSLSNDELDSMLLHAVDHFDSDVFLKKYANNNWRIKSYFLTKKKYVYLELTYQLSKYDSKHNKGLNENTLLPWIRELSKYHEFHDVHQRHSSYYPEFAKLVEKHVRWGTEDERKWLADKFC